MGVRWAWPRSLSLAALTSSYIESIHFVVHANSPAHGASHDLTAKLYNKSRSFAREGAKTQRGDKMAATRVRHEKHSPDRLAYSFEGIGCWDSIGGQSLSFYRYRFRNSW